MVNISWVFKELLCVTLWQACLSLMPQSCISNTILLLSQTAQGKTGESKVMFSHCCKSHIKTNNSRMVNPKAWHHKAAFCEALVTAPSMCTHYCCYHGQCRDCDRWQRSSLRWLIRVSFTKADNNGQSLVSCLDQNFYSEEDLFRSDTPGPIQASPSSELVILITSEIDP